jgi:hypothetical protein
MSGHSGTGGLPARQGASAQSGTTGCGIAASRKSAAFSAVTIEESVSLGAADHNPGQPSTTRFPGTKNAAVPAFGIISERVR